MLTTRGFWLFIMIVASLAAATIFGSTRLTLVSLSLLIWFLAQWFLFQLRVRMTVPRMRVQRALHTARGKVDSVWAGQSVEVVVTVRSEGGMDLPYVAVFDRLPALARLTEGSLHIGGELMLTAPLVLKHHIQCRSAGRLRFEGVQVQVADLQGFFTHVTFLREPRDYRVLPALAVAPAHGTFMKHRNIMPLLGTHRHKRPGTSSELLDLRDYVAGDPPKTIAWKVSARRDRLITREFESEVPIRCTLFLDTSNAVRVGPAGETALARLVEIAAAITQANIAERDLTGVCLFDETSVQKIVKPGRGSKHLFQMLDLLTHVAGLTPRMSHVTLGSLLPCAYGLLQDVYPDWVDREVNHCPVWLPWWSPQPYYTIAQPAVPSGPWWQQPWIWLKRQVRHSFLTKYNRRRSRFSFTYGREYRWRKKVSAVLALRYKLGPGGLALLLEDDQLCSEYVQRFLAEHQFPAPYPFYDEQGRYLFAAPEKANVLAQALLQAVSRGKDNELFVLCVDLLESTHEIAALERAVCVAKARHHQVVAICPWPAGVDVPSGVAKRSITAPVDTLDLERVLLRTSTIRLHRAFARMQHALGRLGVPVICAGQSDTIPWILHRMRRLRVQERGVR